MSNLDFYKSMLQPGRGHWGSRSVSFSGVHSVSAKDAITMLNAYMEHQLSYEELVDWANLILFNDSFDFDGEVLRDCLDRIEESDEPEKMLTDDEVAFFIKELSEV